MAIPCNPKVYARNIAEGYVPFNKAGLRQHTPSELRTIHAGLETVMREYRGMIVPLEEIKAVQHRNQVLQRVNNALLLIRNHAKRHRIPL